MRAVDRDGTAKQIEQFMHRWQDDGVCQWAAVDLGTDRLIGRIGLLRHHDWPLAPSPMDCWRDLLDDAQLISITVPANDRSRAVMKRLGLTYRGTAQWRGLDVVWYAIDR